MRHSLSARLARGTGTALVIHIVSAGGIYTSQVWLARWMGSTEYGIYDYVTTVGLVGAFMAGLGLPAAVLRFVSAYQIQEDWPHLWGIILGSWRQTL
ncbi:MAG: flippase, partial [Cyanobacteria bacterium P01_A01_bin.15]